MPSSSIRPVGVPALPSMKESVAQETLDKASVEVLSQQLRVERERNARHQVKDALLFAAAVSVMAVAGYGMLQRVAVKVAPRTRRSRR